MTVNWAERQRDTNRLVRALAGNVFSLPEVTPRQLYGLSKLTWITNSYEGENSAYIRSTKIPALGDVLGINITGMDLGSVANKVRELTGIVGIESLILKHTGFTNFYKAYRNSVIGWAEDNFQELLPMYRSAYESETRIERRALAEKIMILEQIPIGNNGEKSMRTENFLSPAFFALDQDIKFPLINGNKNVKALLRKLNVLNSSLVEQFDAVYRLFGQEGIVDAADVDSLGEDLPEFIGGSSGSPRMRIPSVAENPSDDELPFKDENDVTSVKLGGTILQRREHNRLTNRLIRYVNGRFDLREGRNEECMFDVLVKRFDGENDLMIEVKSSLDQGQLRMAVGQLFDYWFKLKGDEYEEYLAVLLPSKPNDEQVAFLEWIGIGVIWFEDNVLLAGADWLDVSTWGDDGNSS